MTDPTAETPPAGESREPISDIRPIALRGEIEAALGLSGVAIVGDYLILGADEGHRLQVLMREPDDHGWRLRRNVALATRDLEVDIEAITFGDGKLYVIGSHSSRRRRLLPHLTVKKNRERLLQVQRQKSRSRLYRLPFDAQTGEVGEPDRIDLGKRLRKDPLLRPFFEIPSKENGIDIEGMAYRDGLLLLGFRGPVLRDNYVPVMTLEFEHPKKYDLRFVRLDGQGIRDMVALEAGYLLVSGPVNDGPGPFRLWWWDGEDQIPGRDRTERETLLLGEVSTPGGARAEGIALLGQHGETVDAVVVYETGTTTQAVRMRIDLGADAGGAPAS
ncbi:MAG: DUF3616 domain-containing protein [Chromatiaceae bacterium]|nr:DUF3616 domain-containing protein [Gammaproteobacteria bacterium]MCP5301090.1 DUF3616 domain-containing protein [Chromatiaceae bacterium]MCP5421438.1 DUF3616 domain-containing protein [Chromatiaceae bacterium]